MCEVLLASNCGYSHSERVVRRGDKLLATLLTSLARTQRELLDAVDKLLATLLTSLASPQVCAVKPRGSKDLTGSSTTETAAAAGSDRYSSPQDRWISSSRFFLSRAETA